MQVLVVAAAAAGAVDGSLTFDAVCLKYRQQYLPAVSNMYILLYKTPTARTDGWCH